MRYIKKMQQGGENAFMVYTPNPASTPVAQQTAQGKSSTKQDNISDDLIKMIKDNGIPSDTQQVLNEINRFFPELMTGEATPKSINRNRQKYNEIVNKIHILGYNKNALIKARDTLYSNGGLQEAAITNNGQVFVNTEEGIKKMSIDEYSKNSDKYSLLSNNDLLEMRSYGQQFAFSNELTSILQSGEGMENVQKNIQGIIDKMKTQKMKGDQYMDSRQVQALKEIEGMQGLLKVTDSTESSRVHAKEALNYIYRMMPQSQRNLLRARAAQMGMDPNEGALSLIRDNILFSTQESKEQQLHLSNMPGGSGKDGAVSDIKWLHDYVGNSFHKDGKGLRSMEINTGSRMSIIVPSQTVQSAIDAKTGDTLNKNATIGTIVEKAFSTIGDSGSIYFGDEAITPDKLDNIVSTGEGITKAYLPIDLEYYNNTGRYKPDLEAAQRFSEAEKKIKKKGITNDLQKLQIYAEHDVADLIDANGKGLNISNTQLVQPFAIVQAYAQAASVINNVNKTFLEKVDDDNEVRRILNESKSGKGTDDDYLKTNWFGMMSSRDIYKGSVFIRTIDDMSLAATAGGNLNVPRSRMNADNVEKANMAAQRQIDYQNRNFSSNGLQ